MQMFFHHELTCRVQLLDIELLTSAYQFPIIVVSRASPVFEAMERLP